MLPRVLVPEGLDQEIVTQRMRSCPFIYIINNNEMHYQPEHEEKIKKWMEQLLKETIKKMADEFYNMVKTELTLTHLESRIPPYTTVGGYSYSGEFCCGEMFERGTIKEYKIDYNISGLNCPKCNRYHAFKFGRNEIPKYENHYSIKPITGFNELNMDNYSDYIEKNNQLFKFNPTEQEYRNGQKIHYEKATCNHKNKEKQLFDEITLGVLSLGLINLFGSRCKICGCLLGT